MGRNQGAWRLGQVAAAVCSSYVDLANDGGEWHIDIDEQRRSVRASSDIDDRMHVREHAKDRNTITIMAQRCSLRSNM